jgi:D-xylose 1-dehydrogenase (NADP+, D-xylono-1,5-lactone-forming)
VSTAAPIRWGLLGTARINLKLLAGARATGSAQVVAVGSRSADAARAFADANGIGRTHGSYEALLADDGVDAVYISLPNALHHRWTMLALAAGKHVLCEKPYTRHPEEIDLAWDAAAAAGLVLQEAFMWRHTPQAARLRELLPRLGEVMTIRATFGFQLEDDADIRVSAELEGGSLMDVGCYCVSGSRYVAGEEPELVFGQQSTNPAGVDRRFAGMLRFPSGVLATFHSSFDAHSEGLEVTGRDGIVTIPDPWHSRAGLIVVDGVEERVEPLDPYGCELDDMAAAISGERAPRLGRADALGQARTIAALYRSAEEGVPVRLDG